MARKSEVLNLATITDGKFTLVRMRNVGKFYLTYEFNIHAGHQLINFIASEIRKVYWLAQQVLHLRKLLRVGTATFYQILIITNNNCGEIWISFPAHLPVP